MEAMRAQINLELPKYCQISKYVISPENSKKLLKEVLNVSYTMDKQNQFDLHYLEMAQIWAQNSYCERRKVGALMVKDRMIISDGYNRTPRGFENVCENEDGSTKFMY
jgi:deoxycytidylate deaminase